MSNPTEDFWSSEDQANLRAFLATKTGNKLVPKLAESAPTLFGEGDTNRVLIRSGELRGYQNALQNLLSASAPDPVPPKEVTNYPNLLADDEWQDGQKIQPTN